MGKKKSCLSFSRTIHHIPTRALCLFFLILQGAVVDYYLAANKSNIWLAWIIVDVAVIIIFLLAMITSYKNLKHVRLWKKSDPTKTMDPDSSPFGYIAWGIYSIALSARVIIIFDSFAETLDENDFFGPNTLKTTVGLTGIIFMLFLMGMHDAPRNSEPKHYIEELTGTVIFDIIDAADSMEILFNKEAKKDFLPGMEWAIVIIASLNFVIPTIPLITLSITKFGCKKLPDRLVVLHKVFLAFAVNLPLALSRLIIWHGLSHGISLFLLKNILIVGLISYDLYEHWREKSEKDEGRTGDIAMKYESEPKRREDYGLEDRYNY